MTSQWPDFSYLAPAPQSSSQPMEKDDGPFTYFDVSDSLDDLPLFYNENTDGLPLPSFMDIEEPSSSTAPPSLYSSSNSSSIVLPQSASHVSTIAPPQHIPFSTSQAHLPFREYPQSQHQSTAGPSGVILDSLNAFHSAYENQFQTEESNMTPFGSPPRTSGDTDGNGVMVRVGKHLVDLSYAKELERCLKHFPGCTLSLQEIYVWIKENVKKARENETLGWQNSVRHNLSMNDGFEKVEKVPGGFKSLEKFPGRGGKRGSPGLWRLTRWARDHGVLPTTRYRKAPKNGSKPQSKTKNTNPQPKRQASGRKGGQATRDSNVRTKKQQARSQQTTSAPNQRHGYQQYTLDGSRYGTTYSCASSASPPAFHTVSTPNTPYEQFYPHFTPYGGAMPPTPFVTQPQTPTSMYSPVYAPVQPAIEQYSMRPLDFNNAGRFRNYDAVSSPYFDVSTPEMTDDSYGSFYMTPSSREQSVQA